MELSSMAASVAPQQALVDEVTETFQANVLATDVNFASYFSAGLLSDRDVQLLRRYDKKDRFTQAALWEKVRSLAKAAAARCARLCRLPARVLGDTRGAAAPVRIWRRTLILWWAVRWSPGAALHAATRRANSPLCRRVQRTPRCS